MTIVFLLSLLITVTLAVEDRYYPRYHLAPPHGFMNDPNGFSVYRGEYHLFYQYNPHSSIEAGIAHWGHAKSRDLFHWEHLPIALYPDQPYDKNGVFSGSTLVEGDNMYLYYTGRVNHPGETPDHEEHQCLAYYNGSDYVKLPQNPVVQCAELQPNIRDPKVWFHDGAYYMVIGNSYVGDTLGRIVLYTSMDKINWSHVSVLLESNGALGFMHECPDLFELNGHHVLLFSPQGVEPQGDTCLNLFQTGYIVGDFNYDTYEFVPLTKFRELDQGHDFYATQTTVDELGRRIVIAWFNMWDRGYPDGKDGFHGCMTMPRELVLSENLSLIQRPLSEIHGIKSNVIRSGEGRKGDSVILPDKAGEMVVRARREEDVEVIIGSDSSTVTVSYDAKKGLVTLDRGGSDGVRRTEWRPKKNLLWTIYIDASTIELFCGEGEETFSSRFFPNGEVTVYLGGSTNVQEFKVTQIQRTLPKPK